MDGNNFDALTRKMASGMSRRSVVRGLVGGAAALVGLKATSTLAAPQTKSTICHHTESDTNPWVQITVADPSILNAHLAHGDFYAGGDTGVACCRSQDCKQPDNPCLEVVCTFTNKVDARGGSTCSAPRPKKINTPCNDGDLCTENDVCDGEGTCAGTQKDCSAYDGVCRKAVCNSSTGVCSSEFFAEGTECNDGDLCTENDKCDGAGACVAGPAKDCSAYDGVCREAVCNSGTGECSSAYFDAGTACDDGDECTGFDVCDGTGTCIAGENICLEQCPPDDPKKSLLCPGQNGHKSKCCPTDSICDYSESGAVNCRNL